MCPVIYHVIKHGNPTENTVHFGQMNNYVVPLSSTVPDSDALDDVFLGTTLPEPDLEGALSKAVIGASTVWSFDGHKRGAGATSLTNFQHHLKLEGFPTQMAMRRHVNAVTQCRETIASYSATVLSTDS